MQPKEVSDFEIAFATTVKHLLPENIPSEFYKNNKWTKLVVTWFYSGLNSKVLKQKQGIDKRKALRHLQAIMASFDISHEDKIAGVAYLMSLWFE